MCTPISCRELFGDIKIYAIDSQVVVSWIGVVGCSRNASKEVNSKVPKVSTLVHAHTW
jgi:hypothetical protein